MIVTKPHSQCCKSNCSPNCDHSPSVKLYCYTDSCSLRVDGRFGEVVASGSVTRAERQFGAKSGLNSISNGFKFVNNGSPDGDGVHVAV